MRWLEHFEKDSILLIEANRMRHDASTVLEEVCNHLSISSHSFDFDSVYNANTAARSSSDYSVWSRFPIYCKSATWLHQGAYRQKIADKGCECVQDACSVKAPAKRAITDEQRAPLS